MSTIVVAGSENDTRIAVIDFTTASSPKVVLVDPGFGHGCHVAMAGTKAVAGDVLGGSVRMVDVANPAAPALQGTATTMLAGIGSLNIRGSLVALGESANSVKSRVVLIDFSNPNLPVVLGTAATTLAANGTSPGIGSVAFISDFVVVVCGLSDFEIAQVDFTNPASPVVTNFNPVLSGPPVLDADVGSAVIVAGDSTSGILKWFDAISKSQLGSFNTMLTTITSAAIANPRVLIGSANEINADLVDLSAPANHLFNPGLGGGSTVAIAGTTGACGAILDSTVALIDLSGAPAVLGTADAKIASIATLAISITVGPAVAFDHALLNFQAVRVNMPSTLPLKISNTGTANLSVTGLASSSARFTFSPPGPFTIAPGGNQTVNVTFTPNAETSFNGNLTMHTNDPLHQNPSIGLSGIGGLPHISVSPASLDFGSVAICLSETLNITVQNTGTVDLTVSSVTTTGAPFSAVPTSLVVSAGTTKNISVLFKPNALGAVSGTLVINSDDATNPSISVSLTGTGLPMPPPSISVSPTSLNFGATPVQFFIGLRITISNMGPCQALTVTLTSSGAPFFVTATDPTTVPPNSLSVGPASIPGGSSQRFVVVFAPQAMGAASGTLTITSNDPNHLTTTVLLTGNGVQLNPASLELILDRSGSMSAPAQSGTKMDGLKAAVQLFADLVIPGKGDEMGSVEFDDVINVLTPFGPFDVAKQAKIISDANSLTPRNDTSIGGGLQLGQTQVSSGTTTRKVLLVFTDGLENTPPMISAVEPAVLAAGTEVYAIGLGQPQNISAAALSTLASSANGNFFLTDDTLILRKNFVQVLADAFRQNMAADPIFNIAPGEVREIPVSITKCESRITFVLNWDNPLSLIGLTILAPNGMPFTPNSPLGNQLVRYGQRPGYRYYQIAFPPLDPGSGQSIGPPQLGTWRMRVVGQSLAGASERCTTSVVVESQTVLRCIVNAVDTSQPMRVTAHITNNGLAITKAEVQMTVTAPLKSLAAVSTPAVVQRALDADHHPIPAGKPPLIPVHKTTHKLIPHPERRGFLLELPPPKVDGVYEFEFTARGEACGGEFERFQTFSLYISNPIIIFETTVEVQRTGPSSAVLKITPRDATGASLGPGLAGQIKTETDRGTLHPVLDLHDGSYALRVIWDGESTLPAVTLRMMGQEMRVSLQLYGPVKG